MARPIIAITTYHSPARWGAWDLSAALLPWAYVQAVERAGGRPVLLPPVDDGLSETLDISAGLILAGGPDIEPALYGETIDEATTAGLAPDRDRAELALLAAALQRGTPVLGICRGMQLLNLAYGGTLSRHLPDEVGHEWHRTTPGQFDLHEVSTAPDSRLRSILGERATVHSAHHQGLRKIGDGLSATAWAPDGVVEGIEDPDRELVLGVLWHPEEDERSPLFDALVAAASAQLSATR